MRLKRGHRPGSKADHVIAALLKGFKAKGEGFAMTVYGMKSYLDAYGIHLDEQTYPSYLRDLMFKNKDLFAVTDRVGRQKLYGLKNTPKP